VITHVKDSDDVFYRECNTQKKLNKQWKDYYLTLAAKNSPDDSGVQVMTDVDINYMHLATLNPDVFPDDATNMRERQFFLMRRHQARGMGDQEGSSFDMARIFELNLAHELASEQKKNIKFIEKDD